MADRGQGYKYQLSVTAYLASLLSKDKTVQDYHIFYEVQEVEPFDDIVLAVQYNDSEDFRLYLVQVKSGKVKLDVNTYLKAYNQITENKRWECLKNQVRKINSADIQFWYFACQKFRPQPIPFHEGKQLEIRKRTRKDDKPIVEKNVYELFSGDEEITRKYQDFFIDFYVFLDQDDTNTIASRLKGMWALNDAAQIIDYLDKYFNKNKKESLTKTDFEHELLRIRLWDSIVKPTKIVSYPKESAVAWNNLTLLYNITIVKNELDVETDLFSCILQSFSEKITVEQWNAFVDNEGKLSKEVKYEFTSKSHKPETLKDLLVHMWRYGKTPLVLKSNNSLPQLKDFLNLNQHYIIIDSDPSRRYNEMKSYSLTAIKDLGDTTAERLLQSVLVSMQGRQPTSLHTVINGDKRLMQTVTCSDILKLMEPRQVYLSKDCLEAHNYTLFIIETAQPELVDYEDDPDGDSFSIYCQFDQSSEVYEKVKRNDIFKDYKIYRLQLKNDKLKLLRQFDENKLGEGFQALESFQIDQYGNSVYGNNEDHGIPIIGEVTRMGCVKYLQRYMRKGTIDRIGYSAHETTNLSIKFSETVYPDRDFFKEIDGKICVITGEAGIGKTTFLQALTQTCDPQYYLLFCNLALLQVYMRKKSQKLLKDPLSFLWSKQKQLFYDHFLNILRKDGKRLILLLDSFDEVVSTCKEQVLELIKKLNDETCLEKIIIASRLLTVELLADQFPTIKVTKIEAFSNEYNGHYLRNWNLNEDSLQNMPVEFATNPLYLDMLRKISQNSGINFQTLSRWTLYNGIVDSELERYSQRTKHIIDDFEKENILRFHRGLALKSIFGNNHVTQKFTQENRLKFTNATRLGMLKFYDENEDPVFVHHTFAEFFAAQWLIETTDKEDAKFIYKLMLEQGRHNILDIHSEQFPLHKVILNVNDGNFEYFEQIGKLLTDNKEILLQTDGIGRTALHLAGSYYSHNSTKCLETIIRYMREEGYDLYLRDNLLCWTWIDYGEHFSKSFIIHGSLATHEAYWSYYASSPSTRYIEPNQILISYEMAVKQYRPSILLDLLLVKYFDNDDFIGFRNLCLSSKAIVRKLPEYFELDELGLTALHLAVIYSNINVVSACIKRGDKLTVGDRFGCTPLYYSIMKQNSEIVKLLLEKGGGQLNRSECDDFNIFKLSLHIGNKDIMKMLIQAKDLNFGSDWLCEAIDFGDIEVIELLLEAEIDPNKRRCEYLNFNHELCYRNAIEAIRKYCDYNYDVSSMPLDVSLSVAGALRKISPTTGLQVGVFPLNTAIHARRKDIVHLLLKKGVNINTEAICSDEIHILEKEFGENTPLSCAISSWNMDLVELLLQYGANVNYISKDGLTPLKIAIRKDVTIYDNDEYLNYMIMSNKFRKRLYDKYNIYIPRVINRLDWSLSKLAFLNRRLQIVEVLLRYGADANFRFEGGLTPLDEALKTRNWALVEMLLLHGANPNDLNQWNLINTLAVLPTEDIEIIELLLKNGVNADIKTASGVTLLYVAARRKQVNLVRLLLEYGANADIITCTHTLLAKAKENEEIDVVTLLLNLSEMCFVGPIYDPAYPVEVLNLLQTVADQGDINFSNEINRICSGSNTKFINMLARYATDLRNANGMKYLNVVLELNKPEIDLIFLKNFRYYHGKKNAAIYTATHGNKTMIEILSRNCQGVNSMDEFGNTALTSATEHSMPKSVVQFLLENQADVNLPDKYGSIPLHFAIENQNIDVIEILLKYKSMVDYIQNDGYTPLIAAICKNNAVIVRILLDYGADVNFLGEYGLTPLYAAAMNGNPEIIKTLLRYGAKSDIETCGNTLLYKAIQSGYGDIVRLLLSGKYSPILGNYEVMQRIYRNLANANAVYEFGLTPLHLATKAGSRWIVWILLEYNADPNLVDEHGRTALHYAVETGTRDIIPDLLRRKADVNIKDEKGLTPLDYAKIREYSDIIQLLSPN
ncbi:ankyrin repeat ph and sec7 domain containing protein secg-related [Holotrichia oblita]|uniref:Ankyrin repeat ph and sec7 domain containing protein secg-related n=1 Tax=Holotrichia oblita TaxID=644536 RepID=A0ACB9SJG9_HOLOL|nr:ankyrin repeat ph and sec7 domain containing protein secg-related [Holotrichia oblita]